MKPNPRPLCLALATAALVAFVVRALPLARFGAWEVPVDYDEGVYFSAAALLWKGVLPYRDFVFVHPPGLLYWLSTSAAWVEGLGPAAAFALSRWLAAALGALNTFLVGRLVARETERWAGVLAAALYAGYPEAVGVERGPFLEPVLNAAVLLMAWRWLGAPSVRRDLVAGALAAFACAVKVWGGIWVLAALVATERPPGRARLRFLVAASAVGLALLLPLASRSLGAFVEQTLWFHAVRPPDGSDWSGWAERLQRLAAIWGGGHRVTPLLAVLGLGVLAVDPSARARRGARLIGAAYLLTLVAFMASSTYWSQYNAHLAASECALAGLAAAWLWRRLPARTPVAVAVALAAVAVLPQLRRSVLAARARAPEQVRLGQTIRHGVPPDDCVFALEPAYALAGDRLPPHRPAGRASVDTYASMLIAAAEGGARYPHAAQAFSTERAQGPAMALLAQCRFAVLGWRERFQLSEATRAWFHGAFEVAAPPSGGPALYRRRGP